MAAQFPDLPESAEQVVANLATTHHTVEFTPGADPLLAYGIVLPKGWLTETVLPATPDTVGVPRIIGLYSPGSDPLSPFVTISMTRIPVEVNLQDWVDFALAQDGWEVFESRWRQLPDGLVVDAGAIKRSAAPPEVMRVMASVDGGRVFMRCGVCPEIAWNQWKTDFLVACSSFRLLRPTKEDALEPLLEWKGGDPPFGVAYPASWRLELQEESVEGVSAVDIRLVDESQLLGYLLVKATDTAAGNKPDVERLLRQARRELSKGGFTEAGEPVFPAHDPEGAHVPGYQATAILAGRMWNRDVEARLGFRFLADLAISVTLVSVRQEANPLLWMRCKRAFELVCRLNWSLR